MPTAVVDDMPDFDLIEREITFLEENPEVHKQDIWTTRPVQEATTDAPVTAPICHGVTFSCGTAGCLAGWAAIHLGEKVDWLHALEDEYRHYDPELDGDSFLQYLEYKGGVNGTHLESGQNLVEFVKKKFGLSATQFMQITHGENTTENMRQQVAQFKEEWQAWTAQYDALDEDTKQDALRWMPLADKVTKGAEIRGLVRQGVLGQMTGRW